LRELGANAAAAAATAIRLTDAVVAGQERLIERWEIGSH
jgi:hypothetical protein